MSYHCIYKATYLKETRWGWEHDHTPGWYVTPDESITGYNGGWFKSTPELIMFASSWPQSNALYLEDTYQNPIELDRQVFLVMAQQHYHKVMNRWHQEHAELKKLRKI